MAERRVTADGRILEKGPDGVVRQVGMQGAPQGGIIPIGPRRSTAPFDVPKVQSDIRNAEAQAQGKEIDNQFERETMRSRILREQAEAQKALADAQAANKALQKPDTPDTMRDNAIKAWAAAREIDALLPEIQRAYKAGPGATRGPLGALDYIPSPRNEAFDTASNRLRAPLKSVLGFQGGDTNAASEAAMNVGPFIPQSSNFDATNEDTFKAVKRKADDARTRAALQLGGVIDSSGRVTPIPKGYRFGEYPDLDLAVVNRLDNISTEKRQKFMLEARRRYLERRGAKQQGGRKQSAPSGGVQFLGFED